MRRYPILVGLACIAASAVLATSCSAPTTATTVVGPDAHTAHAGPTGASNGLPPGVDHAHDAFQPGYLGGRTVVYRPGVPAPDAVAVALYQVIYPDRWTELTARPQCDYCDHGENGEDGGDFHDHVLAPPDHAANAAGKVTWHVQDVLPSYTGDPAHDAGLSSAYAGMLPAQSVADVRRLLDARLPDGSPIVHVVDNHVEFGGPVMTPY
jgi:hypothetical protein